MSFVCWGNVVKVNERFSSSSGFFKKIFALKSGDLGSFVRATIE